MTVKTFHTRMLRGHRSKPREVRTSARWRAMLKFWATHFVSSRPATIRDFDFLRYDVYDT